MGRRYRSRKSKTRWNEHRKAELSRTCTKKGFRSFYVAKERAEELHFTTRDFKRTVGIYECPDCPSWHLTTHPGSDCHVLRCGKWVTDITPLQAITPNSLLEVAPDLDAVEAERVLQGEGVLPRGCPPHELEVG